MPEDKVDSKPCQRVRLRCPECGSEYVFRDASAMWDVTIQEWVLAGTQDDMTCSDCGADEIKLLDEEILP